MPVSHIGLTVSHLPTSCSFFLSALQPLGYRYIGQQSNQIGFGINHADFFICQETPGVKTGAAHIAFSAPSRTAVREFYAAALTAGGLPHGAPACRNQDTGYFNAAVLDFDGNSIEVVYREDSIARHHPTQKSRTLDWQPSESVEERDSVASRRLTVKPASSIASENPTPSPPRRSSVPHVLSRLPSAVDGVSSKTIVGTLLGAAAGAAVIYAMYRSEADSVRREAEWVASRGLSFNEGQSQHNVIVERDTPRIKLRSASDAGSYYYTPAQRRMAIEAPPTRYYTPTYVSVPPSGASEAVVGALPDSSSSLRARSSRTQYARPSRSGSESTIKAPQRCSAYNVAVPGKSTVSMSVVPVRSEPEKAQAEYEVVVTRRRSSAPSHHSSRCKHSTAQPNHTSTTSSRRLQPETPLTGSYISAREFLMPSSVSSGAPPLHKQSGPKSAVVQTRVVDLDKGILDNDDLETVVPSDSISCVGSSSSRRSKRTHQSRDDGEEKKSRRGSGVRGEAVKSIKGSEASTVKPPARRGSVFSLPLLTIRDGGRNDGEGGTVGRRTEGRRRSIW